MFPQGAKNDTYLRSIDFSQFTHIWQVVIFYPFHIYLVFSSCHSNPLMWFMLVCGG